MIMSIFDCFHLNPLILDQTCRENDEFTFREGFDEVFSHSSRRIVDWVVS